MNMAILVSLLICSLAPSQTTNLDELLARVAKWEFDQGREPLIAVSDAVVEAQGSASRTREIEKRFTTFLESDATLAGKDFICRQLSLIGTEASVPVLSRMLVEPKTADIARYALERIPGPTVDTALRQALSRTTDRARIGIINTLGRRRDAASVAALRPLALGQEPATAAAALSALAEIGNAAAGEALADALSKTSGALHVSAAEACLKAADRLAAAGNAKAALPIYRKLYASGEPSPVRAGALRGLAAAGAASPVLMEALRASDAGLQAAAIRELARSSPKQLVAELPKLTEGGQVLALGTLAERGDASTLPAFTAALKSPSQPVRIAAVEGLGRAGNASVVATLAAVAAGGAEAEQTAARASLGRIRGKDVDQAVVDSIASAEPKVKLELIRAAGERGISAAAPALLKLSRDADADVRRESLRALRDSGSANDIQALVELVVKPVEAGDRTEAVRSLAAVLRRSDPSRIGEVVAAYTPASDMEARAALMQVMGQSGNAQALALLRGALKGEEANVKRAAILALSDWPDPTPIPDLFEAARAASIPAHQVLAVRSVLRLIGLPAPARPARETVKLLAEAISLARQPDEKRSALALLPRFPGKDALELARSLLNDSEVAAEAKMALSRLERTIR